MATRPRHDPAAAPAPLRRVLDWLSPARRAARADERLAARRRLFDSIGELLFASRLAPSPRNYGLVHSYLSGEDVATSAAVAEALRATGTLSEAAAARIAGGQEATELGPDTLARIAETLEARIAECLGAAGQSRRTAEQFGSALEGEAARLAEDPAATIARIAALTRDAVTATRLAEAQLERTRHEADTLRRDLRQARRAAERDHLTGLPNRRALEAALRALDADDTPATVALCDVDDFKQVNDRFGHAAGDRVLRFVAGFLERELGGDVLVVRHGGEEFACLFRRADARAAVARLDAARERLAARSLVNQDTGEAFDRVTFSAGVAPLGEEGGAAALAEADLALYAAKHAGKNRVCAG
ncbi:GGDEF domain-containing protein [Sphingomonas sp. RHCKR7]|uniref:GGDEF domain-containing protein n=1 Tax=Sphingomonas folli TaxID=2862497 RepID=UPI001C66852F|nr:GGDEF domain-containing protein [Sphingomonas folli]MBW6528241.1 GGDEF domain-containing protein [Sphingomonas folli]